MRLPITLEQQEEIDNLLFTQYADRGLSGDAFKKYREFTGASINATLEALVSRRNDLREIDASRFKPEPDWRLLGLDNLRAIQDKEKIAVIVGEWDADSFSWYVKISAIMETPSAEHPHYTAYWLTGTHGSPEEAAEEALRLGNELAAVVGVDFDLNPFDFYNSDDVYWDQRWWDRKENQKTL